ncbi:MAG: class I SAM-dependent RNA methyltransferase [Vampirovibrionales bacterium]|nr:class I SAM-dependent RNA methyltransferase [Vampirovibrionales bacterium]
MDVDFDPRYDASAVVVVEKLLPGGVGLARLPEGKLVLVEGAAAQDKLSIVYRIGRAKTLRGAVRLVLKPSPDRRDPAPAPCPACDWVHLTREAQLREKRLLVADCMRRLARLPQTAIEETLAPPPELSLRNKISLAIHEAPPLSETDAPPKDAAQTGAALIGYRAPGSRSIVAYEGCLQAPPVFAEIVAWLSARWPGQTGAESLLLRQNAGGDILVGFRGETLRHQALEPLVAPLRQAFPAILGIDAQGVSGHRVLAGQAFFREELGEWTFQVGCDSFFQVNRAAAGLLLGLVKDSLRVIAGDRALLPSGVDLYAGVGTFTFALAAVCERVIAAEYADGAIADLALNCALNQVETVEARHGDVCSTLKSMEDDVAIAIVNPPRTGCPYRVIDWLNAHVREGIIMISCDPATLARDLKRLKEKGEWRIERIQPVDMFADTHHVETVVCLVRGEA